MIPLRLSFSQWKQAATCPASWHASRRGEFKDKLGKAAAASSLVHAVLLGKPPLEEVLEEKREHLLLSKGGLSSDAQNALEWAAQARAVPPVADLLSDAQVELELQVTLGGVPWTCRLDIYNERLWALYDVKAVADLSFSSWSPTISGRVSWVESNLYGYQLALYSLAIVSHFRTEEEETGDPTIGILAIGKRTAADGSALADVRLMPWNPEAYDVLASYLDVMAASIDRPWSSPVTGLLIPGFREMAEGDGKGLPRCEECEWCLRSRTEWVFPFTPARPRIR